MYLYGWFLFSILHLLPSVSFHIAAACKTLTNGGLIKSNYFRGCSQSLSTLNISTVCKSILTPLLLQIWLSNIKTVLSNTLNLNLTGTLNHFRPKPAVSCFEAMLVSVLLVKLSHVDHVHFNSDLWFSFFSITGLKITTCSPKKPCPKLSSQIQRWAQSWWTNEQHRVTITLCVEVLVW